MLETIPEKHVLRRNGKAAYYLANKAYGLTREDFPADGVLYKHWFVGNDLDSVPEQPDSNSVKIGTQTWMNRNLDIDIPGSKAYENDESYVPEYGRLYTWMQALTASQMFPGWHFPSYQEWMTLRDFCGTAEEARSKLSSTKYPGCTDDFGFNALLGGYIRYNDGISRMIDFTGFWWAAESYYMAYINDSLLQISSENAGNYFSVRLIKDS
jgi:uncharacterized protein (TIGR02145 family)